MGTVLTRRAKVDKDVFLKALFTTYNDLEEKTGEDSGKPAYFRFLTLLGFRIFLDQNVDVAILEVGLGGRLDATNCIKDPIVCGVSPIGFDHMNILGYTLSEIAQEKAGIFKAGAPALTVSQEEEAMETLERVAKGNQTSLTVVPGLDKYTYTCEDGKQLMGNEIPIGLAGEHQRENAALAIQLAAIWESRFGRYIPRSNGASLRSSQVLKDNVVPSEYVKGLVEVKWPGRGDIFTDPDSENLTYFVDGAHTPESIASCASWFAMASRSRETSGTERIIIFNCMEERDPASLLEPFQKTLLEHKTWPQEIIFSPTMSSYSKLNQNEGSLDTTWQGSLLRTWKKLLQPQEPAPREFSSSASRSASVSPSLLDTLNKVKVRSKGLPRSKKLHVLVTGSLYLVGDVLQLLGRSV